MSDIYTDLAKKAIEGLLIRKELPQSQNLPIELLKKRAGCFVSLYNQSNELRGCIGTVEPQHKNLAAEIIYNAIEATRDPRFEPVQTDELDKLSIKVDILSRPEAIGDEKGLDPKKYGVIVQANTGHIGVLLPDIEGVSTIEAQMTIAKEKAGLDPDEPVNIYRFTVDRYPN